MYIKIIKKCFKCKTNETLCGRKYCSSCDIGERWKLSGRDFFREELRIRDNHMCRICKKSWKKGSRRFDIHHIIPSQEGLKETKGIYKIDRENKDRMITLCHKCHLGLPHLREKAKKNGQKNYPTERIKKRYIKIRKIIFVNQKSYKEAGIIFNISKTRIGQILKRGEKMGWDT